MEKILIGRIGAAVGLKGEVRIVSYAESPDRFTRLETVFIGGKKTKEYEIRSVRFHKNAVIVSLEGVDDRTAAERLRGENVFMSSDDLEELPEGEFYIRELIGMTVRAEDGTEIGVVRDILTDRPQDVYVVRPEKGSDILIPGVSEFIRNIDKNTGTITVRLIEGMVGA